MKNYFSIKNKKIIVTGGNRGNGLAISKGLIDNGALVIRVDKSFDDQIGSHDFICDLSSMEAIRKLIHELKNHTQVIDGLVNNAGISLQSDNPYSDYDAYQKTISVNLNAVFYLTSEVIPFMKNKGGSIINITSLGAHLGFPNNPAYQISKSGLSQLSRAISKDWANFGIRANNICPGYIKTDMTKNSFNDKSMNEERMNRMIIKRWGDSEDLVGPVIFLISDASSYMTGGELYIDGGWMINGL